MKNYLVLFLLLFLMISCKSIPIVNIKIPKVAKLDTLISDQISIRALSLSNNKVYYGGNQSRVGYKSLLDASKFERKIQYDSLVFEFRSCGVTKDYAFFLNVGNPAVMYRFSKDLIVKEIVYTEKNEKVFYDSMQFWDDQEGIAIGDPTESCLSIIITRDAGKTWNKIPCEKLPKIVDGEAAFAASNTNVVVKGNRTWIVTGGKKARVFYSSDRGMKWTVYNTPIVQGKTMTGIFSADFYDEQIGIIVGGDYENQQQKSGNKALTTDGGKTWKLIAEQNGFGYASCVQFVPGGQGNKIVSVGTSGVFVSIDKGTNWSQLSDDSSFYTVRFLNATTAILAGKNKIVRMILSE